MIVFGGRVVLEIEVWVWVVVLFFNDHIKMQITQVATFEGAAYFLPEVTQLAYLAF